MVTNVNIRELLLIMIKQETTSKSRILHLSKHVLVFANDDTNNIVGRMQEYRKCILALTILLQPSTMKLQNARVSLVQKLKFYLFQIFIANN